MVTIGCVGGASVHVFHTIVHKTFLTLGIVKVAGSKKISVLILDIHNCVIVYN